MLKRIVCLILALLSVVCMTACGKQETDSNSNKSNTENNSSISDTNQNVSSNSKLTADELGWGAVISFGSYEQDNDAGNGKEPVEWFVLDVQTDRMLLLSKEVLDAGIFNETDEKAYWDECTLRNWLNQTFLNDAFTSKEQASILSTQINTPANDAYETKAIPSTQDKVFLLSIEEVEQYFRIAWGESGHFYDSSIKAGATDYAISKGLKPEDQNTAWCLRSTGIYGINAYARVTANGDISAHSRSQTDNELIGIRPAIWINIDADCELLQKKAADTDTDAGIEDLFPTDWDGRYVLVEEENSTLGYNAIHIYCKKAYESVENADKEQGKLFSIYYITGEAVLPESTSLGTYEDYPVEAVVRSDVPVFSSDEIMNEYTDMIYDVGEILDAIKDRIAELEHFRQIDLYGYDLSLYTAPDASWLETGVYALDCGNWSEDSKTEFLSEYNHTSYLSIAPDGTAYLSLGSNEPIKGTVLAAADLNTLPENEPEVIIWFEDGIIKPAYYLQLTLTIHGMDEVELNEDAPKGLDGSTWTYTWVTSEFWTEETLRGDIG